MQNKKVKLSVVLLLITGLTGLKAQEVILSTGGNALGSGGSASYSVGQIVYTTNTGTNGSVAQGVQQPYEISVVTGIEEAKGITLQCSAYPNPTNNDLTLKVENIELSTFNFQLFDINAKLIEAKKIESSETSIVMVNLVPATYFLKIIKNNKEVKTFKIIKN